MQLTLSDVWFTYPGLETPALNDVSLKFSAGERVALIGRNGGGKSTLMLTANGLLRPQRGEVTLDGQAVRYDRRNLLELHRCVGVVFQNPEEQLFSASVLQDISLGPLNLGMTERQARQRVMEVAELCELTPLLDRPTHALSGGEKTRVALAGVLAMDPLYLFADEITNSLDPWIRAQVIGILDRCVEQGRTVVLSTHDWSLAQNWAQRVIWMEKGHVFRQGSPDEVFTDQKWEPMTGSVDQKIRSRRGLNVLFTGNGKGKTSAAMGILARSSGHGLRVGVIQFIKSPDRAYGEAATAQKLNIPFRTLGNGFVFNRSDKAEACQAALAAWEEAKRWIAGQEKYDVLILDEITYLFAYGWLEVNEVVAWLKENKPEAMHLVMTGRYAPEELVEYADLVTEMCEVKHPYREQKLPAQIGVDY